MGRIGFQSVSELETVVSYIKQHSDLNVEGIFTHFSTADSKDSSYFDKQLNRFNEMKSFFY